MTTSLFDERERLVFLSFHLNLRSIGDGVPQHRSCFLLNDRKLRSHTLVVFALEALK